MKKHSFQFFYFFFPNTHTGCVVPDSGWGCCLYSVRLNAAGSWRRGFLWLSPAFCGWRYICRFLNKDYQRFKRTTSIVLMVLLTGFIDSCSNLLPKIPMSTAGSFEGICCRKGRISSRTYHLSRYSKIFPRHTREFTRTYLQNTEQANWKGKHNGSYGKSY